MFIQLWEIDILEFKIHTNKKIRCYVSNYRNRQSPLERMLKKYTYALQTKIILEHFI